MFLPGTTARQLCAVKRSCKASWFIPFLVFFYSTIPVSVSFDSEDTAWKKKYSGKVQGCELIRVSKICHMGSTLLICADVIYAMY